MSLIPQRCTDILREVTVTGELTAAVARTHRGRHRTAGPGRGVQFDAVWLHHDGGEQVLLLTAHVLAMDPVSGGRAR
jgi:mycobactin peptide synthetase MbtF